MQQSKHLQKMHCGALVRKCARTSGLLLCSCPQIAGSGHHHVTSLQPQVQVIGPFRLAWDGGECMYSAAGTSAQGGA
jgi:hypothetical protein